MDSLLEFLDKVSSWLLLPATAYGAFGAFLKARRSGKTIRQTITEVLGGVVLANITLPLVSEYVPPTWHWTAFFLVGWGGLALVERLYGMLGKLLEVKLRRCLGIDGRQ